MIFKKAKYYKSCEELPLYNFIRIVVNGDLSQLVISGKPKDLKKVWNDIFNEYSNLTRNESHVHIFSIIKELSFIGNKLYLISIALDSLSLNYNEDLCRSIKSLGISSPIRESDFESDLRRINAIFKGMVSNYEKKKQSFEESQSKEPAKKSDYDKLLVELSKYLGYRLNPKEVSVSEFVSIMDSYSNHVKSLNKKGNGK